MKLIYPYFKRNRLKILTGLLCMIIVDLTQLAVPQLIKQAVDTLSFGSLEGGTLLLQCAIIAGLGLIMALLRYGWRILLMGSARDLEKGIRDDLFSHILTLDMPYFDRVKTGDIMAHAVSDINHVRMAFGFGLMVLVDTVLLGGATLAIMFWTHPKLTLLAMIPMPFLVIVTRVLGRKMHQLHKSAQESFSQLTELVRERFFGIRIIKVFNFESQVSGTVDAAAGDYFSKNLKRAFVSALLRPMMGLFFNASTLVVLFYGGYLALSRVITPGELVAFLQYLSILSWPIIAIGWMTNLFQRGMASLNRISTLLDSRPDVRTCDSPVPLETGRGDIRLEKVGFSYDGDRPVLQDVTMDIPEGSMIGISGPPGSGKTTLVQLIARLYDIDSGGLTFNGEDISRFDLSEWRRQIALMPQESFLFSGTVRENILMGRRIPNERLDQIIHTCSLANTIERMPDGLDTVVGERGITLSGGQKQRIALARTLIMERPLIILDDPISQIDTHTASKVIKGLIGMNTGATIIIVSHRISALADCDAIHIIKDGRIEDSGTHETLIRTSPFYRDAYSVQQFEEMQHA